MIVTRRVCSLILLEFIACSRSISYFRLPKSSWDVADCWTTIDLYNFMINFLTLLQWRAFSFAVRLFLLRLGYDDITSCLLSSRTVYPKPKTHLKLFSKILQFPTAPAKQTTTLHPRHKSDSRTHINIAYVYFCSYTCYA